MGTIAASAALMLVFYPYWLIVMLMSVLIAHELGHFGMAKLLGVKAALPMFIPLGPLAMGATWIPTKEARNIRLIAMSGPLFGSIVSLAMLIAFALVGSTIGVWFAIGMFIREILNATLGGDGRKFRKAKEKTTKLDISHVTIRSNIHADWSVA